MKCRLRGLAVVAAFSLASHTSLALTTLTFDELPFQPVDDLTFQGVTFDFKVAGVDSTDATYNTDGPGSITYVQDPSLEGTSSGILTLDFATPTPVLEFGVALATIDTLTPGFTVDLFDAVLAPIGSFPVTTQDLAGFTEGQFVYPGGSSVGRAVVSFDATAARFAFDNLTFLVPEPSTALLLAAGLAGLAASASTTAVRARSSACRIGTRCSARAASTAVPGAPWSPGARGVPGARSRIA